MAGQGDEKLAAEFQKMYNDFGKKFAENPKALLDQFHKDIVFYVEESPEVVGHQAVLDYIKAFPYRKANVTVTHAEQITPNHVICEIHEDILDQNGKLVDKLKGVALFVKEGGKWLELQVALNTCLSKKDGPLRPGDRPMAKDLPKRQEPGDKALWAEITSTMDAIVKVYNKDPVNSSKYWVEYGSRNYSAGQPVGIGREGVGRVNRNVRKDDGWFVREYYLTFAEKLSDEFAMARGNLSFQNDKTGEVSHGKIQHVFKKVDGVWLYYYAVW